MPFSIFSIRSCDYCFSNSGPVGMTSGVTVGRFCGISSFQIDLTQSIHSGFDEYSVKYQNDEKGVRHE
jgi:hypothetical protein